MIPIYNTMEEEIFNIISMHSEPFVNIPIMHTRSLAKAIANHFREFIEWYDNTIFHKSKYKAMSVNEVYQFWIDNIKEK